APAGALAVPSVSSLKSLKAADLDGIPPFDVVSVAAGATGGLHVSFNLGPVVALVAPPTTEFSDVTIGDWNGDGDNDLAAAAGTSSVMLFDNQGPGVLTFVGTLATSAAAVSITHGDLDADGRGNDLVVGTSAGFALPGFLESFIGPATSTLAPVDPTDFLATAIADTTGEPVGVFLGDLRRDTVVGTMKRLIPRQDVLVAQNGASEGAVAFYAFDGNAPTIATAPTGSGAFADRAACGLQTSIASIIAADITADGYPDLLQLDALTGRVHLSRARILPLSDRYGAPCAGTLGLPQIVPALSVGTAVGMPHVGSVFTLGLRQALPGAAAILLVGT
ncbi:MAG TPA: VCBS repeat-containing protein, partial [Planctomycetota bacterium]|nr:VCBS repeat-containing protein [Planctomycetota bacterium]